MRTIAEIRRDNLQILIDEHGSVAELNERMGWERTDPRLTRIRNANTRTGRNKPFQMGDALAREIEVSLQLERGWMDNPRQLAFAGGEQRHDSDVATATYAEPTPRRPSSGRDYRTVAYSLAAALEASSHKVDIRGFLAMVDAAFRNFGGGRSN